MQIGSVVKIINKHKFFVIHLVLFFVLFILFYNKNIIIDTNLDLIINPKTEFSVFATGWYSNLYLGISNAPVFSYIFPFGFLYWLLSLFFSIHVVQATIFSFVLFSAFFSFTLFIQEELNNKSIYVYLGSLFYTFNLYTLLTFGTSSFLFPYAFLPLQLFSLRKVLMNANSFPYMIGLAISTLMMSGINPPLVAINLIVVLFYLLHLFISQQLWRSYRTTVKKLIASLLLTVFINFYWILGILVYYSTLSSVGYAAILSEPLSVQNSASTFLNIFRELGVWSFSQGWSNAPYYNYAPTYLFNSYFKFSLYIIPLFVIGGLAAYHEQARRYKVFIVLLLFSVTMAVGSNQGPFKDVYLWAYDHVPLFSMFRSSYKFVSVYIFSLAFFLSLFSITILRKWRVYTSLFLIIIILINAFPFFTGRVFEKNKQFSQVPSYYYEAEKFFQADKGSYRILLLPEQYFAVYNWGFTAGDVETIWNKQLVVRQAGSALEPSNKLTIDLYSALSKQDYEKADGLFKQLNIKYIVQRNDFDWRFYKDISHSPEAEKKLLQPYKKVATIGKLDIYQVPTKDFIPSVSSPNLSFQKISSTSYRLYFKHLSKPQTLTFLQSFNKDWKLYVEQSPNLSWCNDLHYYSQPKTTECIPATELSGLQNIAYLLSRPVFEESHSLKQNYANDWIVDPSTIKTSYSAIYYKLNKDGTIDIEMKMIFKHQLYLTFGLLITCLTGAISVCYLIYLKRGTFFKR